MQFHFCVQDPDVEELADKIVAAGGKKRMQTPRYYYPGKKPYRMMYGRPIWQYFRNIQP